MPFVAARKLGISIDHKPHDPALLWWCCRNKDGEVIIDHDYDWNPRQLALSYSGDYTAKNIISLENYLTGNGCLKLGRNNKANIVSLIQPVPFGLMDDFYLAFNIGIPFGTFDRTPNKGTFSITLDDNDPHTLPLSVTFGYVDSESTPGNYLWIWQIAGGTIVKLADAIPLFVWDQYMFVLIHNLGPAQGYDWTLEIDGDNMDLPNKKPFQFNKPFQSLNLRVNEDDTLTEMSYPVYIDGIQLGKLRSEPPHTTSLYTRRNLDHYIYAVDEPSAPMFDICFWWSGGYSPYTHRPRVAHYPTISQPSGGMDYFPAAEYPNYDTLTTFNLWDSNHELVPNMGGSINLSQCKGVTVNKIQVSGNRFRLGFWVMTTTSLNKGEVGLRWLHTYGYWNTYFKWLGDGNMEIGTTTGEKLTRPAPANDRPWFFELASDLDQSKYQCLLYLNGDLLVPFSRPTLDPDPQQATFYVRNDVHGFYFCFSNFCVTRKPDLSFWSTMWNNKRVCNSVVVPR